MENILEFLEVIPLKDFFKKYLNIVYKGNTVFIKFFGGVPKYKVRNIKTLLKIFQDCGKVPAEYENINDFIFSNDNKIQENSIQYFITNKWKEIFKLLGDDYSIYILKNCHIVEKINDELIHTSGNFFKFSRYNFSNKNFINRKLFLKTFEQVPKLDLNDIYWNIIKDINIDKLNERTKKYFLNALEKLVNKFNNIPLKKIFNSYDFEKGDLTLTEDGEETEENISIKQDKNSIKEDKLDFQTENIFNEEDKKLKNINENIKNETKDQPKIISPIKISNLLFSISHKFLNVVFSHKEMIKLKGKILILLQRNMRETISNEELKNYFSINLLKLFPQTANLQKVINGKKVGKIKISRDENILRDRIFQSFMKYLFEKIFIPIISYFFYCTNNHSLKTKFLFYNKIEWYNFSSGLLNEHLNTFEKVKDMPRDFISPAIIRCVIKQFSDGKDKTLDYEDKNKPENEKDKTENGKDKTRNDKDKPKNDKNKTRNDKDKPKNDKNKTRNEKDKTENGKDRTRNDKDKPKNDKNNSQNGKDKTGNGKDRMKNDKDNPENDKNNSDNGKDNTMGDKTINNDVMSCKRNVRFIMNCSKSMVDSSNMKNNYQINNSINMNSKSLVPILRNSCKKINPSILYGMNDLNRTLENYLIKNLKMKGVAWDGKQYMLKTDLKNCYGRFNQNILMDLIMNSYWINDKKLYNYSEIKSLIFNRGTNSLQFKIIKSSLESNLNLTKIIRNPLKNIKYINNSKSGIKESLKSKTYIDECVKNQIFSKSNETISTGRDIRKKLVKIIDNFYVKKGNDFYKMINGIPQGCSISASLASIYINELLIKKINFIQKGIFLNFADDFLLMTPDFEEVEKFLEFKKNYKRDDLMFNSKKLDYNFDKKLIKPSLLDDNKEVEEGIEKDDEEIDYINDIQNRVANDDNNEFSCEDIYKKLKYSPENTFKKENLIWCGLKIYGENFGVKSTFLKGHLPYLVFIRPKNPGYKLKLKSIQWINGKLSTTILFNKMNSKVFENIFDASFSIFSKLLIAFKRISFININFLKSIICEIFNQFKRVILKRNICSLNLLKNIICGAIEKSGLLKFIRDYKKYRREFK